MFKSSFDTLIDVPEIQDAISARLWLGDISRCARVCKRWNRIFTKAVWRYHQPYNGFKPTSNFFDALQRYGHYIRHLQPTLIEELPRYVDHCKNLVSLVVPGTSTSVAEEREVMLAVLENNKGSLRSLTVEYTILKTFPFEKVLPLVTRLRFFSLRGDGFRLSKLGEILEACPNLQSFRLSGYLAHPIEEELRLPYMGHHPIAKIDLGFDSLSSLPVRARNSIWKCCPQLVHLETQGELIPKPKTIN